MKLEPNTTVSHYKILSSIGKGGMGEVYLAEDTKLDRKAAIKFLNYEFGKDEDKLNRFIQEAKATSALNHPNILTVYGIDSFEGTHYIATEYIDGRTLREVISQKGSLPLNRVLKITIQIAEALSAANAAGIAHRDIKPENIMVREDGYVKVLDFGLAKLTEKNKREGDISLEGETKALVKTNPGVVMGTVSYMSPEQARGQETDARTDIWSLGVVLYEMLAGKVPFEGETTNHTIVAILETEPKLLENIPDELQRIVRKTLTKEKESRYQTARDLVIDLKNLRRDLDLQGELERSVIPNTEQTSAFEGTAAETASGARSTQNLNSTSSLEYAVIQAKSHKLATGVIGFVLIGIVSVISYFAFFSAESKQINSIAVMPFVNEGGNADVEYLSDGMTEMLISSLSKLPNLDVKPRSTVFRYKGKDTDPNTIAAELNVQAILNGRVSERGQEISLFVELIDVAQDKVVWSQQYSRKQDDLVDLQAEIARDVSSRLKPKISDAEETKVTKTYTANSEAYQLYLKGNFYLSKYTEDGAKKGIEYFEQALALDPNYALAHHGIANAYDFANGFYMRPREAEPKAKAAAMKALEIDDSLAETHFLLGKILFWYDWDFPAAERHWKRANELDPSYPPSYPLYLAAIRKYDEAIEMQESLLSRTPLDLNMNMDMAGILMAAGKFDLAIEQNKKALELDPNSWWANQQLGLAYIQKGQAQDAVRTMEKARAQEVNSATLGYLGYAYGKMGRKEDAERVIEELKELSGKRYISPIAFVLAYAGIGDRDKAFDWLDRAFEEREPMLTLLTFDAALESLSPDPRFNEFLDRMNLPR